MFRILIVEDDTALSQLFCRVLTRNGYHTFAAADGEQALALLEQLGVRGVELQKALDVLEL